MGIEKPKREVDEDYLDFIRGMPCAVCGKFPADPHHWKTRASGGSDYWAIAMCRRCHRLIDDLGRNTFCNIYEFDPWKKIIESLVEFIKSLQVNSK